MILLRIDKLDKMNTFYSHIKSTYGTSKLLLTSVMPPRSLIDINIINLMTVYPNDCTKLAALKRQSALVLNPFIELLAYMLTQ